MLLQKLVEYSERHDFPPQGYNNKPVRYMIELDQTGKLRNDNMFSLETDDEPFGRIWAVPDNGRSSNVEPRLLADDVRYTFGISDNAKVNGSQKYHDAYMDILQRCAEVTKDQLVCAVLSFLQNDPLSKLQLPDEVNNRGIIVFRVDGNYVTEQDSMMAFWESEYAKLAEEMHCISCGKWTKALKVLPFQIKGIPGSEKNNASLISANREASWSYGLKQSETASICPVCADKFTKSLNVLLSESQSSLKIYIRSKGSKDRGLAFVGWTTQDVGFDFSSHLDSPEPEQVKALLQSIWSGKRQPEIDAENFYGLVLSANVTRVVMRDWIDTTVGNAKAALATWFLRQRIVSESGFLGQPLGIYHLASATMPMRKGKPDMKELPVGNPQMLIRSALSGTPLPTSLLQQALRRNAAEHSVTYPRAALIKLVLASQSIIQEDEMVELQADRPDPAYHCGRLLAVLEQIQKSALGNVNSSIVDRFYGTASTAPATVFGNLLSGAQPHLSKLRRGKREGTANALQNKLEEVLAMLPDFPRTLKLQEQALFALGYYHQRAYDRAQAKAASDAKKAKSKTQTTNAGGA